MFKITWVQAEARNREFAIRGLIAKPEHLATLQYIKIQDLHGYRLSSNCKVRKLCNSTENGG